jgi:hypothetical protein
LHALVGILERFAKSVHRARITQLSERQSCSFSHLWIRISQRFYEGLNRLRIVNFPKCYSRNLTHIFVTIGERSNEWLNRPGISELAEGFGCGPPDVTIFGV